ncbi:hemogen-like isoform X1 [Apus apus]|uniref:hemogen-like isoform X1 n=1 Tax=Apus apus TaxID=8895 RepID=UPI0021F8F18C|nr:hemogen-like isoform X1 [Apus apus]
MESLGKDHAYSDPSLPPAAACEEYAVPEVIITRRLRDRELLRKRKAEAQEKDSVQWVLRQQEKTKRQRRGGGARRGRGRQPAVQPSPQPDPQPDPQPEPQPKPQPDSRGEAEPALPELAPPEPVYPEQPAVLTFQDLVSGMQPGVAEREPAARIQDPTGEEEVLKPAEAEIPEALNTPLENEQEENEYIPHILF